jgi:hypothetical protein
MASRQPRTVQNINDPNWFLNLNANGDFNTISADQSGYGILSAAEKNSTFIAYFDSIGSTTPEIINQTGFFIRYLIDEQGNVSEPTPDSIALYNLNNIFQGSTAIVESQDATQTLSNLIGEHSVTDIGTIQPLLITETGSASTNYVTTMSFAQFGSIVLSEGIPNFTFNAQKQGSQTPVSTAVMGTNRFVGGNSSNFSYANIKSNILGNWNPTDASDPNGYGAYTFSTSTADVDVDVSFEFKAVFRAKSGLFGQSCIVSIMIEISTNSGASWTTLPITNISTSDGVTPINYQIINNTLSVTLTDPNDSIYMGIRSNQRQFNTGDKVRFKFFFDGTPLGTPNFYGTDFTTWSEIKAISNYSGILQTTASYWDGATYPTDGTPQYLTASLGFTNFINNNMVQITPTASLSMSFSPIIFPANILPGDNIRFEYDPSKVSKIYEVSSLSDGRVIFKINPAIPTGSRLDHFIVYRVINDGNYAILNVKKEAVGQMTGFLKPKYISKTLQDNLPTIINTLKKDGVIPS